MIEIRNLSLDIPVGSSKKYGRSLNFLNNKTGGILKNKYDTTYVRALNNINLTIKKGERIALIGHNGSGKTTLLRVLANIFKPTSGKIIGEFFEPLLNRSFMVNEEHTGLIAIKAHFYYKKKNIKLPYKDYEKKIIDESGLGSYINVPLRTYSSGMAERLQFCLATSTNEKAIAIDEGFGTADKAFTEYATKKIDSFLGSIETLVLASHSEEILNQLCLRGIVMESGIILYDGDLKNALDFYKSLR